MSSMANQLPASEFEGKGPHPFGGFNLLRAKDRLRFAMRTELDPDFATETMDAPADKFLHGGVPEHTGERWWEIG